MYYPSTIRSKPAILWRDSKIEPKSRWKTLCQVTSNGNKFSPIKPAPELFPQLIQLFPHLTSVFEFEYHASGSVTITRKQQEPPQQASSTKKEVEGTDNDNSTMPGKIEGATRTDSASWQQVTKGNKPIPFAPPLPPKVSTTNQFAAYADEDNEDEGLSYGTNPSQQNLSTADSKISDMSTSHISKPHSPEPKVNSDFEKPQLREMDEIKRLVQQGMPSMCTTEELAMFVECHTVGIKETHNKYDTRIRLNVAGHALELQSKTAALKNEISRHCEEKLLECSTIVTKQYDGINAQVQTLKADFDKVNVAMDRKMKFFDAIGELVTKTETTITNKITKKLEEFEDAVAEVTAQEVQALHEQSPEAVISDLLNRIANMEQQMATIHSRVDTTLLEQRIQSLERKLDDASVAQRTNLESDHFPHPATSTQEQPNSTSQPEQVTEQMLPIHTLVDYQRGMLRQRDVRLIESYPNDDGTWIYLGVTTTNILINDIRREHVSNIRTLRPQPIESGKTAPPPTTNGPCAEVPPVAAPMAATTSPVMSDAYVSFTAPSYHHIQHDDDDSHQDSHSSSVILFSGHQYRYPKHSPSLGRVNYAYITDKGQKWNIRLESEEAMKPFYDKLVNRMMEAGVLLRPWDKVVKNESLALITPNNCDNYHHAYQCMSQAIFNYLDANKDVIFQQYSIPRGYIEGYRSTYDGFQVLYETLTVNHPALVDYVASREDPIKPTMAAWKYNIYTFCNALKDYYDYEYRGLSQRPDDHQRKVLKYIRAQLESDERYEKAIHHIDAELKRIYEYADAPLPFPRNLTLEGAVAVTLMKQIPRSIYEDINNSISGTTNHAAPSEYTINKAYSRKPPRVKSHSPLGNKTQQLQLSPKDATSRTPIDAICSACGGSGHDIEKNGCDRAAQLDMLLKYNKKQNQKHIAKATEIYKKLQKQRHSKRDFSKQIKEYKESIRVFKSQFSDVDDATIKQMFLETFREDVDPHAADDIFDLDIEQYGDQSHEDNENSSETSNHVLEE